MQSCRASPLGRALYSGVECCWELYRQYTHVSRIGGVRVRSRLVCRGRIWCPRNALAILPALVQAHASRWRSLRRACNSPACAGAVAAALCSVGVGYRDLPTGWIVPYPCASVSVELPFVSWSQACARNGRWLETGAACVRGVLEWGAREGAIHMRAETSCAGGVESGVVAETRHA